MNALWTVDLPAVATVGSFLWPIVVKARKLASRRHDEMLQAVKDLTQEVRKVDRRVLTLEMRGSSPNGRWSDKRRV